MGVHMHVVVVESCSFILKTCGCQRPLYWYWITLLNCFVLSRLQAAVFGESSNGCTIVEQLFQTSRCLCYILFFWLIHNYFSGCRRGIFNKGSWHAILLSRTHCMAGIYGTQIHARLVDVIARWACVVLCAKLFTVCCQKPCPLTIIEKASLAVTGSPPWRPAGLENAFLACRHYLACGSTLSIFHCSEASTAPLSYTLYYKITFNSHKYLTQGSPQRHHK